MDRKIKTLATVSGIALGAAFLGGAYLWIEKNDSPQSTNTEPSQPEEEEAPEVPSQEWKKVQSENGFYFEYPSDAELEVKPGEDGYHSVVIAKDGRSYEWRLSYIIEIEELECPDEYVTLKETNGDVTYIRDKNPMVIDTVGGGQKSIYHILGMEEARTTEYLGLAYGDGLGEGETAITVSYYAEGDEPFDEVVLDTFDQITTSLEVEVLM